MPDPAAFLVRTTVMQGQFLVSRDPQAELTTVLGSCVATCLYDPEAHIGGMNHYLLAEPPASAAGKVDVHYGVYLMEMLINAMLKQGAAKGRLKAHLYGGANLHAGMAPIGTSNAGFGRDFLRAEGIPVIREDLGDTCARRIDFRPASGQVRCRRVAGQPLPEARPQTRPVVHGGDVELF